MYRADDICVKRNMDVTVIREMHSSSLKGA
jgi:hypothetical protein